MFLVSQYDGASYMFTNSDVHFAGSDRKRPINIVVKGNPYSASNGTIPTVGQAYISAQHDGDRVGLLVDGRGACSKGRGPLSRCKADPLVDSVSS